MEYFSLFNLSTGWNPYATLLFFHISHEQVYCSLWGPSHLVDIGFGRVTIRITSWQSSGYDWKESRLIYCTLGLFSDLWFNFKSNYWLHKHVATRRRKATRALYSTLSSLLKWFSQTNWPIGRCIIILTFNILFTCHYTASVIQSTFHSNFLFLSMVTCLATNSQIRILLCSQIVMII